MSSMKRHQQIMELLIQQGEVTVHDLSEQLDVTGKTIRNDLEVLEQRSLLTRVHGGAVLKHATDLGLLPLQIPNQKHITEKNNIAQKALELIEENDIIALDGGSTTLAIAKLLEDKPLTVITNDLFIMSELIRKTKIRLVIPGGYRNRNLLVGNEAITFIRKLNIQKAFISTTAIHPEQGLSIYTSELYDMKRALLETAKNVYCVVDSSKFGKMALLTFAQLNEFSSIITDRNLSAVDIHAYEEHKAKLLFANHLIKPIIES
ncbi:DeoR family transcriptional regulator [Paenibacillus macquariensis subsp. macquariensis]|uniref:Transcriptional regulator, DeoR family n=2 Tax=Paenibacillus macquariensis TaxID=948756 RepID=A0ABY1JKU2_9BACL|nr:DeoR/GlpR family DNA-binding transcription regulator [Paenibacillus macquariensis]MEC0090009.1 DeoR/GlpR family DNA-binding transcription regulator [Paenibacillus macquariensis]OAB31213.1 DeoR family transcriptional regulator [Paenibacillus macquariensis subsp. macquariensis]SIQ36014.1 transcriptional regulator, DeoR family [Paenibacillus macquariensis]